MFDDRLFDTIMEEMMSAFGADVRTDEGSLAYNACARIAEKLEEVYGDMSELSDNLLVDTMDITHLIAYAAERGISYRYATAPVAKGVFSQDIEIGERFTCNDYTYQITEKIEDYVYKLICETEGTEANANTGALEPIDFVDDYQGGNITETLVSGTEDEDEEEFRKKLIESFQSTAFGGNKADYRNYVNGLTGVGGCKPKRRTQESPVVEITVITSDYGVPSEEFIKELQNNIDPEESSGEGDGMAPICHTVKVMAVEPETVNVTTTISFDEGYSVETSKSQIETVISDYLSELCKSWQSLEFEDMIVRTSQIEARILTVEGVLDVTDTTINGEGNLIMQYNKIPKFGGVTIV